MKKIMFNDRYGLTQAVIEGIKTNTRWIEGGDQFQLAANSAEEFFYEKDAGYIVMCRQGVEIFRHKCRYKLGEVVAVAQRYEDLANIYHDKGSYLLQLSKVHGYKLAYITELPGWRNKMFVDPQLMPHQIRITGIKCERLQDISTADCLKEGLRQAYAESILGMYGYIDRKGTGLWFNTPREAFAALIDKVSGRGTWASNPWVVAYEFELVK
ncbi:MULTISPECIES: hypothetical protein [Alistipes]|uniref:hypothetical protein n=1 Tax=Alistipes TaxID=239759 RepID=UPI001B3A4B39|nr:MULTISPECIES: hypothetical protein [Alistipes]MBQ4904159.1 hypothetical protein [Alistipes sp. Marseille-P2263]MCI2258238.1 hypothetical protein [Alistipes dispar]